MAMNRVQFRASSEGWCVQQEIVLPGQESEPLSLGSREERKR
jgi:hypothetical protein